MHRSDVGVAGLCPAGQALTLRLAARGLRVSVWDAAAGSVREFVAGHAAARGGLVGYSDCDDFVESLDRPRRIVIFSSETSPAPAPLRAPRPDTDRWLEYPSAVSIEARCADLDLLELTLLFQMA